MKIKTTRFGEIEIADEKVYSLMRPIVGYPNEKSFALIEQDAKSAFRWLQSTVSPDLAFPVTMPAYFNIDYSFELPDDAQEELEIETAEEIMVLTIAVIPHENPRASTVNLLAPLVFNVKNHKGSQVILSGSGFDVSHHLFKDDKEQK